MSNLATIVNNILADSGIDDINVIVSTGSYNNPSWITALSWTKITGAPSFITGTGTSGQVAYFNGTTSITSESNLFWDAANDRLGIGTATPIYPLTVVSNSGSNAIAVLGRALDNTSSIAFNSNDGLTGYSQIAAASTYTDIAVFNSGYFTVTTSGQERIRITAGGNIGIGNSNPGSFSNDANNLVLGNTSASLAGMTIANNTSGTGGIYFADGTTGNQMYRGYISYFHGTDEMTIGTGGSGRIYISSTGATTFTSTVSASNGTLIGGSGSTGQVAYFSGTNSVTGESNLFWDAANDRLGIGVAAPTNTLHVAGTALVSATSSTPFVVESNQSATFIGLKDSSGSLTYLGSDNGALLIQTPSGGYSTKLMLNDSGNLGLGVTPSAWTVGNAFEIGFSGNSIWGATANNLQIMAGVAYANNQYEYRVTGAAVTNYRQTSGSHQWFTGPSGTSGQQISFTQAMTLDASGNLGINSTTPQTVLNNFSSSARGIVIENAYPILAFSDTANSTFNLFVGTDAGEAYFWNRANGPAIFSTNNTERMRITSGGSLVVLGSNSSSTPFALGTSTPKFQLMNGGAYGLAGDVLTNGNSYLQSQRTDGNTAAYNLLLQPLGGNVGIGTPTPDFPLDVVRTTTGTVATFGIEGQTINPRLRIDADEANNTVTLNPNYNGATSPALVFKTQEAERIRITSGGNVGIGTPTPAELLDIRGANRDQTSGEFNQLIYSTTTQDAGRGGSIGFGGFHTSTTSSTTFSGIKGFKENGDGGNTAGVLGFYTRPNAGAMTERIRIHSNGGLKFNPQSAAPTAEAGTVYYDSDDNKLKVYNGTSWVDLH